VRKSDLLILAAISAAAPLHAADLGSLHIFDARFNVSPRASLVLHTRFRTYEDFQSFYQFRIGPIVTIPLTGPWSAMGGYYYLQQDRLQRAGLDDFHRAFGGINGRWNIPGRTHLESLTRYERFLGVPAHDFNRFRQGFSWEIPRRRVAPLFTFETLLTRVPLGEAKTIWTKTTFRSQALLGIKISSNFQMRTGYEYRQDAVGPSIHNIITTFEWIAYPDRH
jgi:hypothetical protein